MDIRESGVVGGFETVIKADRGSFQNLSFGDYEYGGDRYRAPADYSGNWYGSAGNVTDFDTYSHYLYGHTIDGLQNVESFVQEHKNQTNDLLFAFQYGGAGSSYPKTMIGLVVNAWYYDENLRYNSRWAYPVWHIVKRVYQDNTTYSDIDLSDRLGVQHRNRFELQNNDSGLVSWQLIFTYKEYTSGGIPWIMIGFTHVQDNGETSLTDNAIVSIKKSWLESQGIDVNNSPLQYETKSSSFGDAAWPGGYGLKGIDGQTREGSFDDSSDTIDIDNKPTLNPFGLGFLNAYEMTPSTWDLLAEALFPDLDFSSATDLIGWLSKLVEVTFTKNRVDCILGALAIPCSVPKAGSPSNVHAGGTVLKYTDQGGVTHNLTAYEVTEPFVDVDCGALEIAEFFANFLDFSGTEAKLFLPGVGFINLKAEYFNGGKIGVKYRFNVIDGSFMCYVTSSSGVSKLSDSLIGQYSGSMCVRLPISGNDYSQIASGLVSAIGGGVSAVATGGASAAITGASVANLTNTLMSKPHMQNSNGYNASSAYMSNKTPYLIIERKSPQFAENYPAEKGLPLNVYTKIDWCSGLTVCDDPVINFANCSSEEKQEIKTLLQSGVIV